MSSRNAGYNSFMLPAGESIQMPAHAEFLRCLEATAPFEFNIDDGGWQYMAAGISYVSDNPNGFSAFRVKNTSAQDNSLVLAHGWGELRDDRLQVSGVVNSLEQLANVLSPGTERVVPALGSVTLVSADAFRRKAIFKNTGAVTVWIGLLGISGHPLYPGEVMTLDVTGKISANNAGLTAGKVSVLIERVA